MRVLRTSFYPELFAPPVTTVVRDSDVTDTLESIRAADRAKFPSAFFIHDLFTMSNSSIKVATITAMRRSREQIEQDMALLFHWSVRQFRLLTKGGTIQMDKPAPLSKEDIWYVFEQLVDHPQYDDFQIISVDREGQLVRLKHHEF